MKEKNSKMSRNLILWSEITDFCLELKKSFFQKRYPSIPEAELIQKVFSDIVSKKEANWVLKKSS